MADKQMTAAQICARALREQGVKYAFGIVGIPVIELGMRMQAEGIQYYHCRNEQAASYAAAAVGFMTGRPGVVLGVSGPGAIHAFAGAANAWSNCWPCLVIGGSSETVQSGLGAFQECPQVAMAQPVCKLARMVESVARIPFHVEQAVRATITGRPGAAYLDLPGDIIMRGSAAASEVAFPPRCPEPTRSLADPGLVRDAVQLLKSAQKPLVVIGKGAAYSGAEAELLRFVTSTNLPFLATPMGKGVISDDDEHSVAAARSTALSGTDVVLLVGARLNWILHFGLPPRWGEKVKVIQVDIHPEEMHQSLPTDVPLVGDAKAVCAQLCEVALTEGLHHLKSSPWWQKLSPAVAKNVAETAKQAAVRATPMNYYWPLTELYKRMPRDAVVVNEGDKTMNIGRGVLKNHLPRSRIDAGTFGTMGVGIPQVLAAAAVHPNRKVVGVLGDSAFGFSMAEFETLCRYKLETVIVVLNNGGIGGGSTHKFRTPMKVPAMFLGQGIRYEKVADAFGGLGLYADTPDAYEAALDTAFAHKGGPALINCVIQADAGAKAQTHSSWLTVGPEKSKL